MELSSSLLFLLLLQTNLLFSAESYCFNNGNYTSNSTYANNLDAALSSLPTNLSNDGFYNSSVGSGAPDVANAIALCRGDAQLDECRGCVRNLTDELRTQCPNQRQAVEWRDYCTLRYSNATLLGTRDTSVYVAMWNTQNATNPTVFMTDLRTHLENLRNQAASGGPTRKVAAANTTANDFQYIFAMVQCSPDMSSDDCGGCLISAITEIPGCCDWRRGGRVMYPSCALRYETYPFYNQTRLLEIDRVPPPPQPPLAPQTPPASPLPPPSGNNTARTIIIVVASIVGCVIVAVLIWIILRKRAKRKPEATHFEANDDMSTAESLKYELSTLRAATNDFSDDNKLGEGGFGSVYKGILSNGREIAVKRLSQNSGQGDQEFKNEVLLLAKLQHRNLVRLLGFCLEGMEKLLVYEFVENASIDQFIFDPIKRAQLEWEKRYKIISGIARGILYLHEDSQVRIIHRDLKPSNVLLDGAMNPKIADFGMARLFGEDVTQGNTNRIVGTFGYMSPEYAMHGQFSIKSDVFSFGVLLLEIISGKKNIFVQDGDAVEDLLSFAWKNWHGSTAANIIDPCLRSGSGSMSDMLRCIHIGLLCVQENAADRPTMATVVLMFNSHSVTMATPTEPAFFAPSGYGSDTSLFHAKNGRDSKYENSSNSSLPTQSDNSSRNEISISDYYPR